VYAGSQSFVRLTQCAEEHPITPYNTANAPRNKLSRPPAKGDCCRRGAAPWEAEAFAASEAVLAIDLETANESLAYVMEE